MREVRALVDQLRPAALDRGLEAALRAECSRFADGQLAVTCTTEGTLDDLPAAIEVATYRIVAESLANVARHSGAAACEVTVQRGATLRIGIRDDGTGIAEEATAGVGLGSMQERAAEVGGLATVQSLPGRGTTVAVELPLRPGPGLDGGAAARRPDEVPDQRTRTPEDSWASRS
jgi:signal transduction histidine kinase